MYNHYVMLSSIIKIRISFLQGLVFGMSSLPAEKIRSLTFLSLLCFALADVRDGLGPFLGVFLQDNGWAPDDIGYVMTAGGLAGMIFAAPGGALADMTTRKRLLLALATLGTVLACGIIFWTPAVAAAWGSKIVQGALAAAIAPTLTGITLGLVGQSGLPFRLGRNEAWNHFGNCFSAFCGGVVGYFYGIPGVFAVMVVMGILVLICLANINPQHIDHAVARGLEVGQPKPELTVRGLLADPALLAVAVTLFFFHLGNAAMLPLMGQSAVARYDVDPAVYTALTIFVAQLTMIAMSLWSAKVATTRGYGILFILALAVLPLRGMIACFYDSAWSVVPVQVLDGVGAGLMGVATPGLVARLLQGTGRINMGLGVVLTIQGVGAALSSSYGGIFANHLSYQSAFFALALSPCIGLLWFAVALRKVPVLAAATKA